MRIDWIRAACVPGCLLAAHAAWAQPEQAKVIGDSVKVYRSMSTTSAVAGVLKAGEVVQIGFSMTGEEGSWCGVSRIDPPANLGYVPCGTLERQGRRQTAAPTGASAANRARECSDRVDRAFQVTGLSEALSAFSAEQQSPLEGDSHPGLSRADRRRIVQAVNTAFAPGKLSRRVKQDFVDSCDLDTLEQVIAGLITPSGANQIGMRVFTDGMQPTRQMTEYSATWTQHPPAPERVSLIQKMDTSLGISAFTVDVFVAFFRNLGEALDDPAFTAEKQRTEIAGELNSSTLARLLFLCRNASDREIARYTELNETEPFRRFNEAFKKAFLNAMAEAAREAASEAQRLIESRTDH